MNKTKITDYVSPPVLMDWCYPPCSSHPSCIRLSEANGNNYELKLHYITMLLNFSEMKSEDAYMFIQWSRKSALWWRFNSWAMMQSSCDSFPLHSGTANKWLYSLTTNSITTWAEFVAVFLNKFFLMHKTARIRSEINQFCQCDKEPF